LYSFTILCRAFRVVNRGDDKWYLVGLGLGYLLARRSEKLVFASRIVAQIPTEYFQEAVSNWIGQFGNREKKFLSLNDGRIYSLRAFNFGRSFLD